MSLSARLIRRSTLLLAAALALWVGLEVASFATAYPNGVSPLQFAMFADNPAVRMMQGIPDSLGTAGGFAVWDAGWMLMLLLGVWAILTASRLLRGEEDGERIDLLLAGPLRATRATAAAVAVVFVAAAVIGAAVSVTMLVTDGHARGAALFGLALAGFAGTFAGVAAVTSQLVDMRRPAAGLAAGALALAWVVRMIGSSTGSRLWVRWLTPMGWLDELRPYGDPNYAALLLFVLVPLALAGLAVALRARRDTGAGLVGSHTRRRQRLRLLGSPLAFAWRSNRGVLLAWAVGLGAYSAVMGSLVVTMIDWLKQDQAYRDLLTKLGFGSMLNTMGFLAVLGSMAGLAIALQVTWRLGAARAEEESGRAEALLARPVSRARWLGGHAALALLGGLVLALITGSTMWLGAALSGSTDITWAGATKSVLNTLPVVVLIGGLAVAAFGVLPRLTVVLPATVAAASYLLTMLGAALKWPSWVLDLSPYTHLALVPADPWAARAGLVMTGIGLLLLAAGLAAFDRRDVVNG